MFPVITTTGQYTKGNTVPYSILGSQGMSYVVDNTWIISGNIRISSAAGSGATSNITSATGLLADIRMFSASGVASNLRVAIRATGGTVPNNTLQKIIISAPEGNDGTNYWGGVTEYSFLQKTPFTSGGTVLAYDFILTNTSLPWQLKSVAAGNTSDVVIIMCY